MIKRFFIGILVVVVVCIGFYYGYRQAKETKKTGKVEPPNRTSFSILKKDTVEFSYKAADQNDKNLIVKRYQDSNNIIIGSDGESSLQGFLEDIYNEQNTDQNTKVEMEMPKDKGNTIYYFHIRFPVKEPRINVLNRVAGEFGLVCIVQETTQPIYRISWNGPLDTFPVKLQSVQQGEISKQDQVDKKAIKTSYGDYTGLDMDSLLKDLDENFSYSSFEEASQVLHEKRGLDIKTINRKVIKIIAQPK